MLRWGILGAGCVAGDLMAPAMRAAGHDLAVVGSRSLTRAQGFAANHGVRRARGSYADVLAAPDVEAVLVALPNDLHEEWVIAALEAGKHVLCARPLAPDAASAGRMAAASAQSHRLLMEASASRFHPRTQALLDVVRSGEIGDVRLVTAIHAQPLRDPASYRAQPSRAGGALLDVGVEPVAMSRWIARAEPDGVRAVRRTWPTGVDGTTTALLAFAGGPTAAVHASFDATAFDVVEVVGTDGVLRVPGAFTARAGAAAALLRDGQVAGTWTADAHEHLVAAFAAALDGPAALPVDDAVATAQVLDRIRTAAI